MSKQIRFDRLGRKLDKFLKNEDKPLPGSSLSSTIVGFIFNLFITLPIFLFILVPITIVYLLGKKVMGSKPKTLKINYLDVNQVAQDIVPQNERLYDLVMFGATGFTGNLSVQYIAKNYREGLKWAIAGRSQTKLEHIRQQLVKIDPKLANLPILIADSSNVDQLRQVVKNTKVIISTVGPYAKYGTNLVATCAEYGTHYSDITGEVAWVRAMIEKYDNLASKSGAMIISCCGCDSIPWDLLSYKLSKTLKDDYKQKMVRIDNFDYMRGNFSGGTFATLQFSLQNPAEKSKIGYDPLLKMVGQNQKSQNKTNPVIQRFLGYNKIIGKFVGLWALADGNAGIVKRSNALLNYSEKLIYTEQMVYQNFLAGFNVQMGFLIMGVLLAVPPLLKSIEKFVFPQPGQGPSEKQMEGAFLTVRALAIGDQSQVIGGLIQFPNDPGYLDTARMLVETGLSMAKNQDIIENKGGFQTPASGVGDILIDRLIQSGSKVEILDLNNQKKDN